MPNGMFIYGGLNVHGISVILIYSILLKNENSL